MHRAVPTTKNYPAQSVSSAETEKPCLGVITLIIIFMSSTVLILSFTVYKAHFYYLKICKWIGYFPTKCTGWQLKGFHKIPDISLFPYS